MRGFWQLVCAALFGLAGCTPATPENGLGVVLGVSDQSDVAAAVSDGASALSISGSVSGSGSYKLYELGAATRGEQWVIGSPPLSLNSGSFTVALFDADFNLLMRQTLTSGVQLAHIIRADSGKLYAGVTPASGSGGGNFRFVASRGAAAVPGPQAQVVYLNFAGARNVRVHRRGPVDFGAFDARELGSAYDGQTAYIRGLVAQAVRADYAPYGVTILTSDDGPAPTDVPVSTVQFGSEDEGLLGLADNVDQYNLDLSQTAIVYIRSFARYSVMELTPEEMALMIANVASHELGHLLGLYHTRNPGDVMDTTGSAWDLTANQRFGRVELEASVFPMGLSDAPRLLEQTVGQNLDPPADTLESQLVAKRVSRATVRRFAEEQMCHSCGTCLHLDD